MGSEGGVENFPQIKAKYVTKENKTKKEKSAKTITLRGKNAEPAISILSKTSSFCLASVV